MALENNPNQEFVAEQAERESFCESVYRAALAEHAGFQAVPETEMRGVIRSAAAEVDALERLGDPKIAVAALNPEIADKISAVWIFSGPGTYDDDGSYASIPAAYKEKEWMWGMDRSRISYAAFLTRKIAEMKAGVPSPSGPISESAQRIRGSKEAIAAHGPALIYNGDNVQNEVVLKALENPDIVMPKNTAHILGKDLRTTLDQIKDFVLPEGLQKPGGEIALVSHAPHLMRIMHMLNRHRTIPKDMGVRLFPIATPEERKAEYATMEIKGLLYYIYLSKDHDAAPEPYPHVIQGETR